MLMVILPTWIRIVLAIPVLIAAVGWVGAIGDWGFKLTKTIIAQK